MSNASSEAEPRQATPLPAKRSLVGWNPWLGVGSAVSIFFASQIVAAIPVSIIYSLAGHPLKNIANISDNISYQFLTILVIEALTVGAILLFLRFYKTNFVAIGLRRPRLSDLGYGLAAAPVYFVMYLVVVDIITKLVPALNVNQQQEIGFNNPTGTMQLALTFLSLVVLPPIAEEILFRGFIYSSLKKGLPIAAAVVVTSGLFAIGHLPAGGAAGPLYIAAIDTFVLSLVLIYLREKTGGLWASMLLHAIKNGVAFAALFIWHAR